MGKPQSIDRPERGRIEGADGDVDDARGYDAGDAGQVGERKINAKNAERERIEGLGQLLATRQGRAWHWHLLSRCGVFTSSFTGNSATFFNEGKRDIGLTLIAELTREYPDHYLTMMKEARNAA